MTDQIKIDKHLSRLSFEKAAITYDDAAVLQREVGDRLIDRMSMIHFKPQTILELGTGTGYCLEKLYRTFPKAKIHALDFAHSMLMHTRKRQPLGVKLKKKTTFINADAEQLPLKENSI